MKPLLLATLFTLSACHVVDGTFAQRQACSRQAGVGSGGLAEQFLQMSGDPGERAALAEREQCLRDHGL